MQRLKSLSKSDSMSSEAYVGTYSKGVGYSGDKPLYLFFKLCFVNWDKTKQMHGRQMSTEKIILFILIIQQVWME